MALSIALAADSPLENTGAPMHVTFVCDDEAKAALGCSEEEPCHVYLELSGLESSATRVFLSGNLHTTSTTLSSILLVTEDGGRTWREAWRRIPYTALDQIQFLDFEHGWIAGENVQTVARDPFLLVTEDGGQTWRSQPLFEEGQPGAIERFWFDSAKAGVLLMDRGAGKRYELYRTQNGGATWELRQASRDPVRFPGAVRKTLHPHGGCMPMREHPRGRSNRTATTCGSEWRHFPPMSLFAIDTAGARCILKR